MLKTASTPSAFETSPLRQAAPRRAFWGLFDRRERWSLSWRGRLIVTSAILLVSALVLKGLYPFLAITHRVDANILVVEGWIHDYAIRAAVKEFRSNRYEYVFTTGGPVAGTGGYINDFMTSASVGAELLKKNGLANESVQMVPSRVMDRDRTYGSAVALRNWFHEHNMAVSRINIVTEDVHARRTRLLFQKAFGKDVQVGIIAVANVDYPANRWWHYSQGLKEVVSEFAAYLYSRLFFWPTPDRAQRTTSGPEGPTSRRDGRWEGVRFACRAAAAVAPTGKFVKSVSSVVEET